MRTFLFDTRKGHHAAHIRTAGGTHTHITHACEHVTQYTADNRLFAHFPFLCRENYKTCLFNFACQKIIYAAYFWPSALYICIKLVWKQRRLINSFAFTQRHFFDHCF